MERTKIKRHNSLRLQGYNYHEPGIYFITIVTNPRCNLFWKEIINSNDHQEPLSKFGIILKDTISSVKTLDKNVEVINFIIMPDHVHLLIKIESIETSIVQVVRWIKSRSSLMIRKDQPSLAVWQRSYYDHIVRNEEELELSNSYIEENPSSWKLRKGENDPF